MYLAERLHQLSFLLRGGHSGGALDPAMAADDVSQTWNRDILGLTPLTTTDCPSSSVSVICVMDTVAAQ